jgi:tRNA1(Val) A37 N6-methylase TrmN6
MPVLPREGADAIRVLVRAVKAGKGPETAYPALTLNNAESRPTEAAEAVLRASEALPLAEGDPRA